MKCLIIALIFTLSGFAAVKCADKRVRFDGFHVYQLQPKTRQQLEVLQKLESFPDSYIFLNDVHHLNSKIYVLVDPKRLPNFLKSLAKNSMPFTLVDTNAQASLENNEVASNITVPGNYTWKTYHTLNSTYNWMHSLAANYTEVEVVEAGNSYEGRKILCLNITYGPGKKTIFLEGGMHAREWISPATTTYIANQLLTSRDQKVREIAQKYDWTICPHINPDGFVYTHTTNRLWRKTRTPYGGNCFGADPNRNWDHHWNETGTTGNRCGQTYAGPRAFSEKETKSLSEYIRLNLKDKILLYVSYHSFLQMLLYPYGYTTNLPSNNNQLKRVSDVAVNAIRQRNGTEYYSGNIHKTMYPSSGSSLDYMYDICNVSYSYGFELPPGVTTFWFGFKLPADKIIPTGEESLDALVAMIEEIEQIEQGG